MTKKMSVACKSDEDMDKSAFMRCDISEDGKKIGDFNIALNPNKGEIKMEMKGKRFIELMQK